MAMCIQLSDNIMLYITFAINVNVIFDDFTGTVDRYMYLITRVTIYRSICSI